MPFSIGIVGLPNVGKSSLFKAITKIKVDIAAYPFTTISPNVGMVAVPDERLLNIAEIIKPEKVTPTIVEFIDIAGLVKGAHRGEGLGNQFLAQIRNCDAILMVIRAFNNPEVENILGEINPEKEIEILKTELLMKDLESLEKILKKFEKVESKKTEILKKIKEFVSEGGLISEMNLRKEEKLEIKEYQFLTQKPILYLLNVNSKTQNLKCNFKYLEMNLKEEEEISEFSEKERKELKLESKLDQLIVACYNILDLITFYTVAGGKEAKAWTLKRGENIIKAARLLHSDFEEKFIKAEVLPWEKLVKVKSWSKAKEKGLIKIVGKDYIVEDGDIIEFKI
jgi:GTP-binding protein YchF